MNCFRAIQTPQFFQMKPTKTELFVRVPKKVPLKGISWQTLHFYSFLLSRTIKKNTKGFWIPCWSKTLKKKYGKKYLEHIDRAISLGWVERNLALRLSQLGLNHSLRSTRHLDQYLTYPVNFEWSEILMRSGVYVNLTEPFAPFIPLPRISVTFEVKVWSQ